jgi:hypothetical protein
MAVTIQSNIHQHTFDDIDKYALFLGGLNVTHDVLQSYDPLKTGWGRIFMVRVPNFVNQLIPDKMRKFKHILEFANTSINGLQDMTVQFANVTGGYASRQFDIPVHVEDGTNRLTIGTYEFSGSPLREVIHYWVNGVSDIQTTFSTYYGLDIPVNQANHTAEFIYCTTDQTGRNIEYACQFCNCFPTNINVDSYNTNAGDHNTVQLNVEFSCVKYESPQINAKAKQLLNNYQILRNSLAFNGGNDTNRINKLGHTYYDSATAKINRGDGAIPASIYNPNESEVTSNSYVARQDRGDITFD